mmetsp:Transcript_22405/g.53024  ORF Transcript_22405/g.53024 Transcript_22405/m.53024 type:complete len:202 (-) Transcript_22405:418-1023(-)
MEAGRLNPMTPPVLSALLLVLVSVPLTSSQLCHMDRPRIRQRSSPVIPKLLGPAFRVVFPRRSTPMPCGSRSTLVTRPLRLEATCSLTARSSCPQAWSCNRPSHRLGPAGSSATHPVLSTVAASLKGQQARKSFHRSNAMSLAQFTSAMWPRMRHPPQRINTLPAQTLLCPFCTGTTPGPWTLPAPRAAPRRRCKFQRCPQ